MKTKQHLVPLSCALILVFLILQPAKACIIILVPTINVDKVTITVPDPFVCGVNCWDNASVDVTCPAFACMRAVNNGCPSDAECKAPRNPDGTRNAMARAHGNCWVPERWTGWIVLSGSGCTANAKAAAGKKATVTNVTEVIITFGWQVIWLPRHSFYWVTAFDDGVNNTVEMTFTIEDVLRPGLPLMESISILDAQSPSTVFDSTGLLMWERSPFWDQSRGKLYSNAFSPMPNQIPVGHFTAELKPGESLDLEYKLTTESKLLHSQSILPLPPSGPLGRPDIISKTVGIPACLEVLEGDITGDCKVDLMDFVIMASQWLQTGELL